MQDCAKRENSVGEGACNVEKDPVLGGAVNASRYKEEDPSKEMAQDGNRRWRRQCMLDCLALPRMIIMR